MMQRMNGPTILDAAITIAGRIFFIRGHLNKALRYSQDCRIKNYAAEISEFFKANIFTNYSKRISIKVIL